MSTSSKNSSGRREQAELSDASLGLNDSQILSESSAAPDTSKTTAISVENDTINSPIPNSPREIFAKFRRHSFRVGYFIEDNASGEKKKHFSHI